MGTHLPGTGFLESWAGGPGVGWDSSLLRYPWIFLHKGVRSALFMSAPCLPVGWMQFLIVVRLPFSSISDIPEWWLFYILIVILMWFCEEVSHVCLCHHLDWKPRPLLIFLSFLTVDLHAVKYSHCSPSRVAQLVRALSSAPRPIHFSLKLFENKCPPWPFASKHFLMEIFSYVITVQFSAYKFILIL